MKPLLFLALSIAAAEPVAPVHAAGAQAAAESPAALPDSLRAAAPAPERDARTAPPAPAFTPDRGPARFVGLAGIVEVVIP